MKGAGLNHGTGTEVKEIQPGADAAADRHRGESCPAEVDNMVWKP